MIYTEEVHFSAAISEIWKLLTLPEMTQQYMFGCAITSTWEKGSPVEWVMTLENGEPFTAVKGEVLEFNAPNRLHISMLDPNMGIEDVPENYTHLTYELRSEAGGTILRICQDFTGTEQAQKRYEETLQGWPRVIESMQSLL